MPTGFDIEIGRILAAGLGIENSDINWKETISDNREPFLQGETSTSCWRRTRSPTIDVRWSARPDRTT